MATPAPSPSNPGHFIVDVPDTVVTDVISRLRAIEDIMRPYFVALSENEKKHLSKIADETIPFAEKVNGYMDSEPQYNPPFISVPESHKDFANFMKLRPVVEKIQGLENEINNMDICAGNDSYIQFLAYYNSVREASKRGIPGAKAIYDELSKRFPATRRKPTPPTP